jgi:hypothetical protein
MLLKSRSSFHGMMNKKVHYKNGSIIADLTMYSQISLQCYAYMTVTNVGDLYSTKLMLLLEYRIGRFSD